MTLAKRSKHFFDFFLIRMLKNTCCTQKKKLRNLTLGGALLRLFHMLCFLAHASFLFVDDYLTIQDASILPISAAMLCSFCILCKIPVSWKKCELSHKLTWTGWKFNFRVGTISIPEAKRFKLLGLCQQILKADKCSRKTLEQFLGLAMWLTQLFKHMRTWLHTCYHDLHNIPASHYSVHPDDWTAMMACLSNDLVFHRRPAGTAIPVNSKLLQVRHQPVTTLAEVRACFVSDKRLWLRIRDLGTNKRKISAATHKTIQFFAEWVKFLSPTMSMWPKPKWDGLCVADAFASGTTAGIGGAVFFPSRMCRWFSLPLSLQQFQDLDIPMHDNLQKDISSLETLAQIALVYTVILFQPGFRIPIRLPTLSDNTAAESVSNALFTTTMPLALFVEKLSLLVSSSGITVDTSHISGQNNELADKLSRWRGDGGPPCQMLLADRVTISLQQLWTSRRGPKLFPKNV